MKTAFAQRKILGKNGASRIILEQMKRVASAGHKVYLYCDRCEVELPSGVKLKKYLSFSLSKEKRRAGFAEGFSKFCRKNCIDVSIGNGDTLKQDILFMHNIPELQDADYLNSRIFRLHDRVLKEQNFHLLVCNSYLMQKYFLKKYNIPDEKTAVAYPGYDPGIFNTENRLSAGLKIRSKYGIKREFILGFVSSGDLELRGVSVMTDAVAALKPELAEKCAVFIIGKDKKLEEYKARLESVSKVQVFALVSVNDIQNYYKSMDVLLHPSKIETFGMTIMEARACGVPVITSKQCGAHEVFCPEEYEILMEKPESKKLAEYIEKLLTDRNFYDRVASAASEAAGNHTWNSYFATLSELYSAFGIDF